MRRGFSIFALAATFLVLAPWCGSLLALACPADCCCGHSALADSCQDGACIRSAPATVASSAAVSDIPVAAASVPFAHEVAVATVSELVPLDEPAPTHSPPKLYLQNASFLI